MVPQPGLHISPFPLLPAEGQYASRFGELLGLGTLPIRWQVEMELKEMALGVIYKMKKLVLFLEGTATGLSP